jgi:hypothetical protein
VMSLRAVLFASAALTAVLVLCLCACPCCHTGHPTRLACAWRRRCYNWCCCCGGRGDTDEDAASEPLLSPDVGSIPAYYDSERVRQATAL